MTRTEKDPTQDLDHSAKKVCMDVNTNLTPAGNDKVVNLHGSDLSDEDEIAELQAHFNELGDYLIEARETVLQQVEKDEGVWMWGMAGHDLTQKAGPIVEEFVRVMHKEEQSGMVHTWLWGKSRRGRQANLAMLGSHTSSDWDSNPAASCFEGDDDAADQSVPIFSKALSLFTFIHLRPVIACHFASRPVDYFIFPLFCHNTVYFLS
ncbi:uncharacterized protein EI90DRAFT_3155042, partial [Cantharellus anzutake]|uniref:uncharacterized protein n=1 Tax=Cantharellus anzutake TaxID=1750568 RepID=UPI001906426D